MILHSEQIKAEDKEVSIDALQHMASDVKDDKVNRLTFKVALNSIKEIVTKTSDIASPALSIIKTILSFFS